MVLAGALFCCQLAAQETTLHNSFSVAYTTLKFDYREQYIGAGLEYRFMLKPWLGAQVEASKFPQAQAEHDAISGGSILQCNGSVVAGHRWGKVGVYGEGGYGYLHTNIFKGGNIEGGQLQEFYSVRNYPDILLGTLIDVSVDRRWSLTFDARDNLTFISTYTSIGLFGPLYNPAIIENAPEGRAGVAFHF